MSLKALRGWASSEDDDRDAQDPRTPDSGTDPRLPLGQPAPRFRGPEPGGRLWLDYRAAVPLRLRPFGGRTGKGLLRRYLCKVTGLPRAQMTRLIAQFRATGSMRDRRGPPKKPFPRRYTPQDIRLLAELDALHGTLSGPATRKLCERAYTLFGDVRYVLLAAISNGHLYNLRHSRTNRQRRGALDKTRPSPVKIGERRPPQPNGRPGFLRVDTVHQGDLDGIQGLYHLNAVDEITQMQVIVSVEKISERYLLPALEKLLDSFPFLRVCAKITPFNWS
jgi:hypothetical protein